MRVTKDPASRIYTAKNASDARAEYRRIAETIRDGAVREAREAVARQAADYVISQGYPGLGAQLIELFFRDDD